jgi:hypothetical protein
MLSQINMQSPENRNQPENHSYKSTISELKQRVNSENLINCTDETVDLATKCSTGIEILEEIYEAKIEDIFYDNAVKILEFVESRLLTLKNISNDEFIAALSDIFEVSLGYLVIGRNELDESNLAQFVPADRLGLIDLASDIDSDTVHLYGFLNFLDTYWSEQSKLNPDDIIYKFEVDKLGKILKNFAIVLKNIVVAKDLKNTDLRTYIILLCQHFTPNIDTEISVFYIYFGRLVRQIRDVLLVNVDQYAQLQSKLDSLQKLIINYNLNVDEFPSD